jgi:hypothetical protein
LHNDNALIKSRKITLRIKKPRKNEKPIREKRNRAKKEKQADLERTMNFVATSPPEDRR